MQKIFINGISAKAGGGKTILNNYLSLLKKIESSNKYYIAIPQNGEYKDYTNNFLEIIDIESFYTKNYMIPITHLFIFPRLLKRLKIDKIFNLADIPIPTTIPQVYLFDWSYAVYPESVVWKRMDLISYVKDRIKLSIFKKYIKSVSLVIAQTETMKKRLQALYGLKNITVIPNAVSLENYYSGEYFNFNLPDDKFKLLCLSYHFPHKNLEIFIPLAKKIKENSLPYCIIITISSTQHRQAEHLLNKIEYERLNDIIINVGPVDLNYVPSLYSQSDALLMPTLLESFSSTYVEAMFHSKPVLTSDYDFARDICGDAAFYFNPLEADSILSAIELVINNNTLRQKRIEEGKRQLNKFLSWEQVFAMYQDAIGSLD